MPHNYQFTRSCSSVDSVLPSDDDHAVHVDQFNLVGAAVDNVPYADSLPPIRAFISLLDGYHDFSGFPWWFVLVYSTVVLRLTLLPVLIVQLHKLKTIGKLLPKLPPPFPPPFSGRSFGSQFSIFRKEKNAIGCPSLLWVFAYFAVQAPVLLTWISTIHIMSRNHHPGFDSGGMLWFYNLAEYPHGLWGPTFPLLVSALHYLNVQVSFGRMSIGRASGSFGKLVKLYQVYLELLTIPILFGTFNLAQGPLICWLTNSSFTLIQQLVISHPDVRGKLGLPDKEAPVPEDQDKIVKHGMTDTVQSGLAGESSVDSLSPKELVALSVKYMSSGLQDEATSTLRLALDKDPEYVRALLIMGRMLLQKNLIGEGIEYLERAISKLVIAGLPVESEDIDLLILSSMWAGIAYSQQGKFKEGMMHLERLTSLEEPTDSISRKHYYEGLLMLSSALLSAGRKAEALEHLRRAAAYDPERYTGFLEQCEKDEDDFVGELANSRRRDC